MKQTLFLLAALLIVGCQGSDDILSTTQQTAGPDPSLAKSPACRRVEIHGFVTVPGQFNTIVEVSGSAEYVIRLLPRDPIPGFPEYTLELSTIVATHLREIESGVVWQTAGASTDDLGYNDGDELSLTRRYWVAGLRMWLTITFSVTANEIQVAAMWFQLPNVIHGSDGD